MTKDQIYGQSSAKIRPSEVTATSGSKFIGATFLYMALALLLTFGVVAGLGAVLRYGLYNESAFELETFLYFFIGALILYIPVMIWVNIAACRNGRTVGPAFFVYSLVMGVLISPIALYDFYVLLISFGTTCLAFAVMALIAWTTKKNLSSLAVIGIGLIFGALILSLVNLLFYFLAPAVYTSLYAIVSVLFFVAIILLTVVDLKRVKEIAYSGMATKNLAMLCALNLYVDFIYIFIRLLRIVAVIFMNRR